MKLSDLLKYKDIVIQCHDNPDADALASGYALYLDFAEHNSKPRFIYGGKFPVQKSNLCLMIEALEIPITYVKELEAPELLVTVDCQYDGGNVTHFDAAKVAVIDHHQITGALPEMNVVRGNIFNEPSVVVDTHVLRISNKLGLVKTDDPVKAEFALMKEVSRDYWIYINHWFIALGRTICKAPRPKCEECYLKDICPTYKKEHR